MTSIIRAQVSKPGPTKSDIRKGLEEFLLPQHNTELNNNFIIPRSDLYTDSALRPKIFLGGSPETLCITHPVRRTLDSLGIESYSYYVSSQVADEWPTEHFSEVAKQIPCLWCFSAAQTYSRKRRRNRPPGWFYFYNPDVAFDVKVSGLETAFGVYA